MSLKIGKAGRKNFTLPLDVATWAMAIHGVRGKGKTVTAAVIVEEVLKQGVQVVVIDPTDVWSGLKSSASGDEPGFPVVILGGTHQDLELYPEGGKAVADFVVENDVPVVLSLRHLRKGEQRRFVTDFCEHLYFRKGEAQHRRPLLLVIDEASRYIPQRVMGESARLVGAIEDIVRMGRASGFGVVLIDQRPATVNKDVLTQIELLVCHAVTAPQDRAALDEWIKGKDSAGHRAEFLEHLASLDRGEAWFWLPMADVFVRVHVRMRETFDSSRTPGIDEDPLSPTKFAEIDLSALQASLEASIEEAKSNDPKELKKRVRDLEKELAAAERRSGPTDQEVEQIKSEAAEVVVDSIRNDLAPHVKALYHALCNGASVPETVPPSQESAPSVQKAARSSRPMAPSSQNAPRREARQVEGLTGPQSRILNAAAWLDAIGITPSNVVAVAFMAGYRPGGGAFNNPKGSLRSLGLIDYPAPGMVEITDEGRSIADVPDAPLSLDAFHRMVFEKLPGPESRILEPLLDAYPSDMSTEELAEAAGYSSGGGAFNNPRGRLRTLGLIDYPSQGRVVALDILFPAGLR